MLRSVRGVRITLATKVIGEKNGVRGAGENLNGRERKRA